MKIKKFSERLKKEKENKKLRLAEHTSEKLALTENLFCEYLTDAIARKHPDNWIEHIDAFVMRKTLEKLKDQGFFTKITLEMFIEGLVNMNPNIMRSNNENSC